MEVVTINYSSRKFVKESTLMNCRILYFLLVKIFFSKKKFKNSWDETECYYNEMYSAYISWSGFFSIVWWICDSEIYLSIVNSET